MKKTLLSIVAVLCLTLSGISAQEKRVEVISTKYAAHGNVLDTLETSNPDIKLILYTDNTWEYRKLSETVLQDSVFLKSWDTLHVQGYNIPLDSIPVRTTVWLADSLDRYCCPNHVPVLSKFGIRHRRRHMGVDLPSPTGTPAYAAFSGKVRYAKRYRGYGNLVIIRHANGLETYYAHLSEVDVKSDDWVEAGQVIGKIGSTGHSTGPHLHFETRHLGYAFDPEWIIDFGSGNLRQNVFVLKRKYFSAYSRYTPEDIAEEEEIMKGAEQEKAEADRLKAEMEARRWHTIRKGDTLSRIAARNGTTVSAICKLNGIKPTTTLQIGKILRVR